MVIKNPKNAPEECPRFDFCCINNCPLHKDYNKLKNDPSDYAMRIKQKCTAKNLRKRIGTKWNLKNKGMKKSEITAARNWEQLPEEVKKERIRKLMKLSPVSQCLEKGLVVHRKSKSKISKTEINQIKTAVNGSRGVGE